MSEVAYTLTTLGLDPRLKEERCDPAQNQYDEAADTTHPREPDALEESIHNYWPGSSPHA